MNNLPKTIKINKTMRTLTVLVFLFFFQASSIAQKSIEQLDKSFEEALQLWNIPGMSIGIIKDGKVVLAKGYGVLKAKGKEKPDSKTMYAIASNTKAFTTTALATLVEEGKLSWNDKVRKYIPDYELYDSYTSEQVTIRDILSHKVGFANFSGDVIWYKNNRSAADLLKRIKYVPKAYDFRNGYGYSNLMYMSAGEVIKSITGNSWSDYVKARFFEPLQMTRTITSVEELGKFSNVATPHKPIKNENKPITWTNWDSMGSAGAIISSVDDMLKWINLHLSNGKIDDKTYFSQDQQEELWHPNNSYKVNYKRRAVYPMNFSAYGLGFGLYDYEGQKVITHSGGYDGMYSRVAMVPEQGLGIVILTNSMKSIGDYLTYDILDYFLNRNDTDWHKIGLNNYTNYTDWIDKKKNTIRTKQKKGTTPTIAKTEMEGSYYDDLYGAKITVSTNSKNELKLNFEGAPDLTAKLAHWHYNTFEIQWENEHAWFDFGTLGFITNTNNEITGLEFDVPNGDIFFDEIKAKKQNQK